MSGFDAAIDVTWGGDERQFRLAIDQCLALEEKRGCGLAEIRLRLLTDRWYVDDIRETIRLGLVGAGIEAKEARRLVEVHCEGKLFEGVLVAHAIIARALAPPENEPDVGKDGAVAAPEIDSQPPPSTETALQ